MTVDAGALAREIAAAYDARAAIQPLSSRGDGFALASAYAVESDLARARAAAGHGTVGLKVGYANKAVWRALKLKTLVWAHMYDDTVRFAEANLASIPVSQTMAPKIEPEIVFKLRSSIPTGTTDPAEALGSVEWLALGFEIIDSVYPDWKFRPEDFVAAFGLHRALIVGAPLMVTADNQSALAAALPTFSVSLSRDDVPVATGSGKNSLGSPALCLIELAAAVERTPRATPLGAGALVSSGTLTESQPMGTGQTWRAELAGLDLPPLTLRTIG